MESSSKRAKAPVNNITQVVAHCLADGCTADLSLCRDYHRRHKVCQIHSKTPKVTIAGREQRFCQQCSRFHSLVEFDEGKRSCRKRLDGHNRRRRKPPQPDKNSGLVFSPPPTGSLLSFSSATPILSSSSWSAEPDMMLYDHPPTNYNQNQLQFQFQFIHDADANANSDPDRALSLLSPAPQESVHNYGALGLGHHYPFEYHQETNPPLVSHIPAGMMFQSAAAASDGSSSTAAAAGSHQTLTFMWE